MPTRTAWSRGVIVENTGNTQAIFSVDMHFTKIAVNGQMSDYYSPRQQVTLAAGAFSPALALGIAVSMNPGDLGYVGVRLHRLDPSPSESIARPAGASFIELAGGWVTPRYQGPYQGLEAAIASLDMFRIGSIYILDEIRRVWVEVYPGHTMIVVGATYGFTLISPAPWIW